MERACDGANGIDLLKGKFSANDCKNQSSLLRAAYEEPAQSRNAPKVGKPEDTTGNKIDRQIQLFEGLLPSSFASAVKYVKEKPGEVATTIGAGLAIGAGFAAAVKNPGVLGKTALPYVRNMVDAAPKVFGVLAGADVTSRFAVPMYHTWQDPNKLSPMKKQLADNVGHGLVDYAAGAIGGLTGAAGAWKLTPEWINKAPAFEPKPSLRMDKAARETADDAAFKTRREDEVKDDVVQLYEKSFPLEERQPVDEIKDLVKSGRILVHTTRDRSGAQQAFSFVSMHDETGYKFANLDFIATEGNLQSKGIGSLHARRLNEQVKQEHPSLTGMTLEMEAVAEPGLAAEVLATRRRRAMFYDRLDAPNTNVKYNIMDFQDPSYRGPAEWRAWVYKPEEFNAVKAARLMMTDEGGYGLSAKSKQVKEFDRANNYWEPPLGSVSAGSMASSLSAISNRILDRK